MLFGNVMFFRLLQSVKQSPSKVLMLFGKIMLSKLLQL